MGRDMSDYDLREYLKWLRSPDADGECDSCHNLGSLWQLPIELDDEPDAGWRYCAACFRRIIERAADE